MPRLHDVVVRGRRPRLLLVGINPGRRSGAVGHHFAGNGNPFWRLLHASGLTPELIAYADDQRLGELGIALTNLCARTTRTAAELRADEIARGRVILARKIARWRPAVVAFVGVTLYRMVVIDGRRAEEEPGPGPKRATLAGARVFVVPNPSGLNASFPGFAHKLIWFRRLRVFVDRIAPATMKIPSAREPDTAARKSERRRR